MSPHVFNPDTLDIDRNSPQKAILGEKNAIFICEWSLDELDKHFHLVNIRLTRPSETTDKRLPSYQLRESEDFLSRRTKNAVSFLSATAQPLFSHYSSATEVKVKIILPCFSGYVVRSDILRKRMILCKAADRVEQFVTSDEYIETYDRTFFPEHTLLDVLGSAVGGISEPTRGKPVRRSLRDELKERLSFPWLVSTPLSGKRLVLVDCRYPSIMENWLTAAFNLGIRLTVVGPHGQWLQAPGASSTVEQYIPIDMTLDDQLHNRIAEALRRDPVGYDGITTFTDTCFVEVAKAAHQLGLFAAPVSAVETAVDKYKTREISKGGCTSFRARTVEGLKEIIRKENLVLDYPLIVKPSQGWGSDGVSKVHNETELMTAAATLERKGSSSDIIVETYLDGPEVDANFVLQDGNLLFFELVDDFPCSAERDDVPGENFIETDMVYPSALPKAESDIIRDTLLDVLLNLGFRTGFFHLEARVRHSSTQYMYDTEQHVMDLRPKKHPGTLSPSVTLLEINQRAGGTMCQFATAVSSGIDITALHLLAAINEPERFRALAQPFKSGNQNHTGTMFVTSTGPGTYNGDDFVKDLQRRRPDLMAHVTAAAYYAWNTHPVTAEPLLIGFINPAAESRAQLLQLLGEIRQEWRIPITF